MTTPLTAVKKPRRWFSPRFSLRMLMLAVTAAAVGTAFWWRWPVTQTTVDKVGTSVRTETITYHRGLRGSLIKHGMHRITRDGEVELEEYYREGVRHGPFRRSWRYGTITGGYYAGRPHGSFEHKSETSDYSFEYMNGKLLTAERFPCARSLLRRVADGTLNEKEFNDKFYSQVDLEYTETPLGEVIDDLHERYALPMTSRWKRKTVVLQPSPAPVDPPRPAMHEIPFSDEWILLEPDDPKASGNLVDMRPRNLAPPAPPVAPPPIVKEIHLVPVTIKEPQLPLIVGIDAILSPLGLVLDHRYGVLCIVDAEGAADWKDTTGVMELRPARETALAEQLDSPAQVTCLEPLKDVLRNLATTQEISVEFRPADDPASGVGSVPAEELASLIREAAMIRNEPVTRPAKPVPITLRQLLGLLLDQANLHCHEEKGVLIIEPMPKDGPTSAKKSKP